MYKLFYLIISFTLCAALGLLPAWLCFAAVFVLYSFFNVEPSFSWEIPMGPVLSDICLKLCSEYDFELFRILAVFAAGLTALTAPKKLFLYLPAAAALIFIGIDNSVRIYILSAFVWCATASVFKEKLTFRKKYC